MPTEEKTIIVEGEDLNGDGTGGDGGAEGHESGEDKGQEGSDEKTTYTKEEVEEMLKKAQSDGDKGVQKLLKTQQFKDLIIDEVGAISKDTKRLIEISDTNPEVAEFILKKYYDGMTIDAYAEKFNIKVDLNDPKVIERKIATQAQKIADDKQISKEKSDFIEKLKMTPDEKEKFEEAFSERRALKSFSTENLQSQFEKAYREIDGANLESMKELQKAAAIAKGTSTGSGKDSDAGKKTTDLDRARGSAKDFLKTHKL